MYFYNDLARRIEVGKVVKRGKLTVDELLPGEVLDDTKYVLYLGEDGKIRGCNEEYVFDIIEDAYRSWEAHIKSVLEVNHTSALEAMLIKEWYKSIEDNKDTIHPEAYKIFVEAF